MKKTRGAALVTIPLSLALGLAGCAQAGGGASTQTQTQDAFNSADSMFATMMIPHHEQAIEMSDMILETPGVDERVEQLAQQIKDAQAPEIEQMRGWLDEWGVSAGDHGTMDHGDGMMSEDDMAALEDAEGDEAARLFLEQMIVHHEGAVEMAQTQLADGENPEALALAQSMVDTQTAEIAEMQELLEEQ